MQLSIIVITYNDSQGAAATLNSLHPFVGAENVEVLLQDGGSTESHLRVLRQLSGSNVSLQSRSDGGVYAGMNLGLARSAGDWVWFLNGGDESLVLDAEEFVRVIAPYSSTSTLISFGYVLSGSRRSERRAARPWWYMRHAMPTSHQAILYPGQEMRRIGFDEKFRFAGDYHATASLLEQAGCRGIVRREVLARFSLGGASTVHSAETLQEMNSVHTHVFGRSWVSRASSRFLLEVAGVYRRLM